jgi:hypothetical protein
VTAPPVAEEALPAEPVAELEQAWMALAEDEGQAPVTPVEAPAQPVPAEPVTAEEITAEAEPRPEEEAAVFPAWAVAEAAEMILETGLDVEEQPTTLGPDWVLLAEAEKAEIRTFEELEPVALPDLVPTERERIEEEIVSVAEVAPAEPEPPARPTWVALEEQPAPPAPAIKERVAEAKRRVTADKEDDLARLELARGLWAAGQREQAYTEYEQLIKSPLLDNVVADLEKITVDEPSEEPALRLLGDAYMRDDRLDESLAAYRRALATL